MKEARPRRAEGATLEEPAHSYNVSRTTISRLTASQLSAYRNWFYADLNNTPRTRKKHNIQKNRAADAQMLPIGSLRFPSLISKTIVIPVPRRR
jgi:hypothetical protein